MRHPLPADVASRLGALRPTGDGYMTRCPAHDDGKASLSIALKDSGKVVVNCHAGCDNSIVIDALGGLGITTAMLSPDREREAPGAGEWTPCGPATAVYDYRDATGKTLFQVLRTAGKQFPQRRPDPASKSGWKWNLADVTRVLYRLPELIEAVNGGETIWICEGEKDVEALRRQGQAATCNPGGAGKWRDEYSGSLAGVHVTIVADKDAPGQAHARAVAESLEGVAESVRIVEAAEPHKDAAAHLSAKLTLSEFVVTRGGSEDEPPPDLAPGIHDFLAGPTGYDWIVPGILERPDRLILTGFEGFGKSYLVRQLAVAIAAGVHPFREEFLKPSKVLFIDCENSDRQTRRHLRKIVPVAASMGVPVKNEDLRVIVRPQGVDLTSLEGAAWILERVSAHRPDVLFIGSLYKLHEKDPKDEMAARQLTATLDRVRALANCAVVIEGHAGHGGGMGPRSVRPIGSSLYMRWPEHGIGLAPYEETSLTEFYPLQVKPWRGSRDREENAWPAYLTHGSYDRDRKVFRTWPWVEHLAADDLAATPRMGASA